MITILTILLLIVFLVIQRITILKYKELSICEKSFIASLTHDLKSPTRAQINMLNLLLKGKFGKLNPEQYEMVKLTCSSSKYMSNLVGTILAGYKYEKNSTALNKKYFDIIELINKLLIQNKFLICDKNLNIKFNPLRKECIVYADELQIERVILNLLSNAITYGLKNTDIDIRLKQNTEFIKFSISNRSKPLSNQELKNIFNQFSHTKNSQYNNYSTGIGLYTAKKIIEKHKGIIFAKSTSDGIFTCGFKIKTIPKQIAKEKIKNL